MNGRWALLALPLAAAPLAGCGIRADFVRPNGQALTLAPDPERAGGLVAKQGDQALDEESFYRIVEDPEATRRFTVHRRAAARDRTIGGVAAALGLGLTASGGPGTAMNLAQPSPDPARLALCVTALVVGAAGLLVGVPLALHAEARAGDPDVRLMNDPERMRRAVERYNLRLLRARGAQQPLGPAPSLGGAP